MANQFKTKQSSQSTTASSLGFSDADLNTTLQEFMVEEEKETGKSIWNIATISGMAMLFIAMSFLVHSIGFPIGEGLAGFVESMIGALPIIGGALITLVGFGFLVGDRKRTRKFKKAQKKQAKKAKADISGYSDIPGAENVEYSSTGSASTLSNALDDKAEEGFESAYNINNYGYRESKKLMKSRTDKKWAGVCGGLAKYFGISSTVVRFAFVALGFVGWGTSFLVYFVLSLAMPKEPIELMDDFD